MKGKLLLKILKTKWVAYLLQYADEKEGDSEPHLEELQTILEEFSEIFDTPKNCHPLEIVITESLLSICNSR